MDDWSVTLELNTKLPMFVAISDTGTYGLTGKANLDEEDLSSLNYEQYVNERWSRFEALGYANPDPRARGARGQGKFVFIGTSQTQEIIYETLRGDGVYRIGHWITRGAKPLMEPLEGEEARDYLKKHVTYLEPLKRIGTRIIIIQPTKELASAFIPLVNCDISKYISETWWERLLQGCKIYVSISPSRIEVTPPKLYRDLIEHPENFKHKKIIKDADISFGEFTGARVKQLVIAYSEDEIPELLEGIAVQRGGMKVTAFDITQGNEHIDPKYRRHIFGWITFNEKAEEELRKNENITHYGFKKIRGSLAQNILGTTGWLSKQIREFAEKELGIVPEKKAKIALERVQEEVVYYLNQLARSMGYQENVRTGKKEKKPHEKGGEWSPIRIQMPPLVFPGPSRRVNFGEELKGVKARVVNESREESVVKFEMTFRSSQAERMLVEPAKTIERIDVLKLLPKEKSVWYGPDSIAFSKDQFSVGRHTLKAEIVAVEGEQKGQVLHKITRAIYVEVNPPAVGKFNRFEPAEFPDALKKRRYQIEEEEEGLVVKYNIEHPAFRRANNLCKIAQRAKADFNPVYDYLLDIGLSVLVTEDLKGESNLLREERDKFKKLIEKDFEGIHEKVLNNREILHQELLFDAYAE